MVLTNSQGVFNLVDTNGRRSDLINGYSIYSGALYELGLVDNAQHRSSQSFSTFPNSLNQYYFYQKAFERSEVFKENKNYAKLQEILRTDRDFRSDWFHLRPYDKKKYPKLKQKILNNGVEDRARHYMNTLRNIGLSNHSGLLTENGQVLIGKRPLRRDVLEDDLFQGNLQDTNLMLMRQALKIKVFEYWDGDSDIKDVAKHTDARRFYSPIKLAIYWFLKRDNRPISKHEMTRILQNVGPRTFERFSLPQLVDIYERRGLDQFIERINMTDSEQRARQNLSRYQGEKLDRPTFLQYFRNGNSNKISESYWEFYDALYEVVRTHSNEAVERLMTVHQQNKSNLKSALGFNKVLLKNRRTPDYRSLVANNPDLELLRTDLADLNVAFYKRFWDSKRHDRLHESLTGVFQVMDASHLFEINPNGQIRLKYFDIFKQSPISDHLEDDIFGQDVPGTWEGSDDSDFFHLTPLTQILRVDDEQVHGIVERAMEGKAGVKRPSDLHDYYTRQETDGFQRFVENEFPKEKIFRILRLFSKRDESKDVDKQIKASIFRKAQDAQTDIPTMFEYVVGIAWYYLSDDDYNLYNSFRLSMGANYLPITHAAGGDGDIMVPYDNLDLMIEVTLMNEQSQKRGEWEPVLRHSVNLNTESKKPHQMTLFVANDLDYNTINIWRAVSAVPLKESRNDHRLTDGRVKIMPVKSDELINFSQNDFSTEKFIDQVFRSFEQVPQNTDDTWRRNILQDT